MSYSIEAIIGDEQTLRAGAAEFGSARIVPLLQGLAMIPLTDELFDEMAQARPESEPVETVFASKSEAERFPKLTAAIAARLRLLSNRAPVAYIDAEFFGGIGTQGAIVWLNAQRVLGPVVAPDAINQALRLLGVKKGAAHDEFDALGLGRHRSTKRWVSEHSSS